MTIKEFSQKHSLVFFWATIVLVVLFLLTTCIGGKGKHMMMKGGYGYDRYEKKMMNKPVNDMPDPAGTVEEGTLPDPNIPLEVQ